MNKHIITIILTTIMWLYVAHPVVVYAAPPSKPPTVLETDCETVPVPTPKPITVRFTI